jgi:hypothetical protein
MSLGIAWNQRCVRVTMFLAFEFHNATDLYHDYYGAYLSNGEQLCWCGHQHTWGVLRSNGLMGWLEISGVGGGEPLLLGLTRYRITMSSCSVTHRDMQACLQVHPPIRGSTVLVLRLPSLGEFSSNFGPSRLGYLKMYHSKLFYFDITFLHYA